MFVKACFADEGPTLKRFKPRARGRGMRIRKRTCHITVIVSRYSPDELAALRADNEAMRSDNAAVRADNEALRARVAGLEGRPRRRRR